MHPPTHLVSKRVGVSSPGVHPFRVASAIDPFSDQRHARIPSARSAGRSHYELVEGLARLILCSIPNTARLCKHWYSLVITTRSEWTRTIRLRIVVDALFQLQLWRRRRSSKRTGEDRSRTVKTTEHQRELTPPSAVRTYFTSMNQTLSVRFQLTHARVDSRRRLLHRQSPSTCERRRGGARKSYFSP